MPDSSTTLHEPRERIQPETLELHRAIVSLMEELEAVDWYGQRVDATDDEELRAVLVHNRDEEKEHACMTLEWIRRRDPKFDELLRRFLFTEGPIAGEGHGHEASATSAPREAGASGLAIGSLREAAS